MKMPPTILKIKCKCDDPNHILIFIINSLDGITIQWGLPKEQSIWTRIQNCWNYIINNGRFETRISNENVMKIRNYCEEYLEGVDIKNLVIKRYDRQWKPYFDSE
jgi:hypothetical protein